MFTRQELCYFAAMFVLTGTLGFLRWQYQSGEGMSTLSIIVAITGFVLTVYLLIRALASRPGDY